MLVNTASTHSKQTGHKLIIVADHDKVFNSSINLNGTEVLYLRSLNEAFDWMNRISSGETKSTLPICKDSALAIGVFICLFLLPALSSGGD